MKYYVDEDIEFGANDLLELGVKLPSDANILFARSVADWSWGTSLVVFESGGKFFYIDDSDVITESTQQEVLDLMVEFVEMADGVL